jgi:hypothetical protein
MQHSKIREEVNIWHALWHRETDITWSCTSIAWYLVVSESTKFTSSFLLNPSHCSNRLIFGDSSTHSLQLSWRLLSELRASRTIKTRMRFMWRNPLLQHHRHFLRPSLKIDGAIQWTTLVGYYRSLTSKSHLISKLLLLPCITLTTRLTNREITDLSPFELYPLFHQNYSHAQINPPISGLSNNSTVSNKVWVVENPLALDSSLQYSTFIAGDSNWASEYCKEGWGTSSLGDISNSDLLDLCGWEPFTRNRKMKTTPACSCQIYNDFSDESHHVGKCQNLGCRMRSHGT